MRHSLPGDGAIDRIPRASAALNEAIDLAEFVGCLFSGSLALLSNAGHNLSGGA